MAGTNYTRGRRRGLVIQDRDVTLLRELWVMRVADRNQLMMAAGFGSITRINTRLLALTRAGVLRRFFIGFGGSLPVIWGYSFRYCLFRYLTKMT